VVIRRMDHVGVVVDDLAADMAMMRTRPATAGLS
jgi:hypothetical protein